MSGRVLVEWVPGALLIRFNWASWHAVISGGKSTLRACFFEEERIISYTLILLRSFLQILSIFNKKFHLKVVPIQISMLLIFLMIFKGVVPVFLALPTNARILCLDSL